MTVGKKHKPRWTPGEIYRAFLTTYGPQHWWPGATKFEIVVGSVLTQNTDWRNVEHSVEKLNSAGLTDEASLLKCDIEKLQELIRPSGYMIAKSQTLRVVSEWFLKNGSFKGLKKRDTEKIREELLAHKGIGEETADAILLYALDRPLAMSDAYTKRIAVRLGVLNDTAKYGDCAKWVSTLAPMTTHDQNEMHALIVHHGKVTCKKRNPNCNGCVLSRKCPRIGNENNVPS